MFFPNVVFLCGINWNSFKRIFCKIYCIWIYFLFTFLSLQYQVYVPSSDPHVCCGSCKNISCSYPSENGTTEVFMVICTHLLELFINITLNLPLKVTFWHYLLYLWTFSPLRMFTNGCFVRLSGGIFSKFIHKNIATVVQKHTQNPIIVFRK